MIYTSDLYSRVLMEPASAGANALKVISGYATAPMANRHIQSLAAESLDVHIELIHGMAIADGVSLADHQQFLNLEAREKFRCHYRNELPAVHAKLYVWLSEGTPVKAFQGSANYSQVAFLRGSNREEIVSEVDPARALEYWESALSLSLEQITLLNRETSPELESVRLPLVMRNGEVHRSSGLNWAFRGNNLTRNKDEAYIPVPAPVQRMKFFPERTVEFTILTDDDYSFIGRVAQDNGKAIHSRPRNSIMGAYFRRRMSLPSQSFVETSDLDNYGRRDVTFYKLDDETYYMDFSINN